MKNKDIGFYAISLIVSLTAWSCGAPTGANATGSTSGGGSTGDICSEGKPCNLGPHCCSGATGFDCNDGKYAQVRVCSEPLALCVGSTAECTCDPASPPQCLSPKQEQFCTAGLGGVNQVQTQDCPPGQSCVDGKGCIGCDDICKEGTMGCSPNLNSVTQCQRPTPDSCADFFPVFDCAAHHMRCDLPGNSPSQLINFCINECGGRGVELSGQQCEPDPNLPCGFLLCGASGELKGDHISCLGGGLHCNVPEECASCQCMANVCIGDKALPCAGSAVCPH